MRKELETKTNRELLGIYNGLAHKPLSAWKGQKSVMIDRIMSALESPIELLGNEKVREQIGLDEPAKKNGEVVSLDAARAKTQQPKAAEKAAASETKPEAAGNAARTIREAALHWLCFADHYENRDEKSSADNRVAEDHAKARSVGITYLDIIERIKEEFPGCDTSVACLRWYSVKVRMQELGYEGYRLCQRRPRAKPSRS